MRFLTIIVFLSLFMIGYSDGYGYPPVRRNDSGPSMQRDFGDKVVPRNANRHTNQPVGPTTVSNPLPNRPGNILPAIRLDKTGKGKSSLNKGNRFRRR